MTTPCEIQIYSSSSQMAQRLAKRIEKNSRRLETKYNFFSQDSFLTEINQRTKDHVLIDRETHDILQNVRDLSKLTQGVFDITTGTLKQCLQLSSSQQIQACQLELKQLIGPDSWQLQHDRIVFSNNHVKLDLGGVIKEVAVDQAGLLAKQAKMSALINFGGDIYVNGNKPDGSAFNVAIKNPKDPSQHIAIVQLTNQGLTTSAHYERSTLIDGQTYSHIIDGRNEDALKQNDLNTIISATAISDSVLTSGLYTTALMIDPNLKPAEDMHIVLIDDQLQVRHNL